MTKEKMEKAANNESTSNGSFLHNCVECLFVNKLTSYVMYAVQDAASPFMYGLLNLSEIGNAITNAHLNVGYNILQ